MMILNKHYYDLYLKLKKEKSFDLAEKSLRKAIELEENALYYYELAQLLKRQSRWWQVVDNMKQALTLDNSNKQWKLVYVEALEKMNYFNEVVKVFESFDEKEMGSNEHFRYADALEKESKQDRANKAFQKAIELDSKHQSNVLGIGILYEKKGKWVDSLRCYKEKAKNEPFNALLHYKLGLSYDRNYEWKEAQKSIAYAITLDNSKSYFFNRLAFNYERNGEFLEASEVYDLAIHKEKAHKPYWYYRLGYSLSKAKEFKASCKAFLAMHNISIEEHDRYEKIEEKIKEESRIKLSVKLHSTFVGINDLTFKKELAKLIELAKDIQAWDVVERGYKELLLRDEKVQYHNFLGFALYKQKKYEEASESFIKQRILQEAHGIPEKVLQTNKGFNQVVTYVEYLKKENSLEKSIVYESDETLTKECESYKLFLKLMNDKRFKSWNHIWVIPKNIELLEEYKSIKNVIFISKNTNLYLKYLATSKYLINSATFPSYFIRQKGQKSLAFFQEIKEETVTKRTSITQNFLQATHLISYKKELREASVLRYNIQNILTAKILEKEDVLSEEEIIDFFFFDNLKECLVEQKTVKKSILFFVPFEPNGIGSSILNLLNNIDLDTYSVTVTMGSDDKMEKIERLDKRINVITRFGRATVGLEEQWLRDKLLVYTELKNEEMIRIYKEFFSREFRRIFGAHTFDGIIDFNGYRTFWTSLFAFGNAKYKSIYLHNDMQKEHELRFPSLSITFNLYKYFNKLVSVSESAFKSNKETLGQTYNLLDAAFVFSNNAIDFKGYKLLANEKLETLEYEDFMKDNRVKFVNVGRLSPEKGQIQLIEAFTHIVKHEKNVVLYIIGEGALYGKIMKKIKENNMQEHIILLGQQQNPYVFIKNANCMVLTSKHEGQSLVLLEALVLGTACISTDIPGPRTVLENGYGTLVGESVKEITEGIQNFLMNPLKFKEFDAEIYNERSMKMFYENIS